jgi:molecular chaperone DnaK
MTTDPLALLRKHGLGVIESALRKVVGRPHQILIDEQQYRQQVIDPAWSLLPAPLRLHGRQRLCWDQLFLALRTEVFDLSGGRLSLRPDATARLEATAARVLALPTVKPLAPMSRDQPAAKPLPHAPANLVLGIDLGTTYSVAAHLDERGRPRSVPNAVGELLTPSVVLFGELGPIVGREAVRAAVLEPDKVAECAKRDMGAKSYRKKINGEYLPPEVIASFVLRSLKADAERLLGPTRQAVITVPAYFDEARRRATMDAGRLAGLEVLDIINEPTAAAIAYGYQHGSLQGQAQSNGEAPRLALVFDLGGGTFDVTIVEMQGNRFKAIATDGDVYLGGKDWDEKLVEIAAERFRRRFRDDPRGNPSSSQDLWLAAEVAKRILSEQDRAVLTVNHLGTCLDVEITREEFEAATAPLLGRTRTTTEIVVRQEKLTWADIDQVLITGGSTRMPMVRRMLEELTGKPPDCSLSPDEAVAHGAALYADLLMHQRGVKSGPPTFSLTNINSHSLGIVATDRQSGRKRTHVLIPKNTALPHSASKVFKTLKANQSSVAVHVIEGESVRPEACTPVGECSIRDLPPDLPAGWPVEVRFAYDTSGRLRVSAKLKGHPTKVRADFVRDCALSEDDMVLWVGYLEKV